MSSCMGSDHHAHAYRKLTVMQKPPLAPRCLLVSDGVGVLGLGLGEREKGRGGRAGGVEVRA